MNRRQFLRALSSAAVAVAAAPYVPAFEAVSAAPALKLNVITWRGVPLVADSYLPQGAYYGIDRSKFHFWSEQAKRHAL